MRKSSLINLASALAASCLLLQACGGAVEAEGGETAATPATTAAWETVWSDDFDGETLDRTKWSAEESCWGGGNNERQCYTDRPENIRVENGVLVLSARPEAHKGPLYPAHYTHLPSDQIGESTHTSGKVITYGKADWKYGRVSARIKLPAGQGAWAAFWMMPAQSVYGGWPLSGEIDIMESVNLGAVCDDCKDGIERRTSGAVHFGGAIPENTYRFFKAEHEEAADPTANWTVYSVEWAEGVIQWFVDDKIVMRLDQNDWYTDSENTNGSVVAPFDQAFYINLNLAIGGHLSEAFNARGLDETIFPAELQVDWVRVEQCAGDRETGLACLSNQKWEGRPLGPSDNQAP